MDDLITFDKSFAQRFQEYYTVFDDNLPNANIKKQWGFYLELSIDVIGWQAVWKIPRLTCESLKITFPSVVLVVVANIDIEELKAVVKVLAIQDDIMIPEIHQVPLTQLWPTKSQDKSVALNIEKTANVLDMLRFFYTHLFMPWDLDDESILDWKADHLESRLRLYYDVKNKVIPDVSSEYIKSLLTEARRLQYKRDDSESKLRDIPDNMFNEERSKLEKILMEVHVRLLEIRTEIDILENPILRRVKVKKHMEIIASRNMTEPCIWVIFNSGTADKYITFLENVKKYYPSQKLKSSASLSTAFNRANFKDIFILNDAQHSIPSTSTLEHGGVLIGIGHRDKIVLTTKSDHVMFDLGDVLIENVTIDAYSAQCAILIRSGKCTLKNCKLTGDKNASTHQGIIVLSGAELELVDCEISGFATALVGNSGAAISMANCSIQYSHIGLKIFDKCKVMMQKVDFRNCEEHAVVLETDVNTDNLIGGFETLKMIPEICVDSVNGINNTKGDVAINQKKKLRPFEDLFSNPDLDPTIVMAGDDDYNQAIVA